MIICGVDPDAQAHGIAIYWNGRLTGLHSYTLMEIQTEILQTFHDELLFSIEDVCSVDAVFKERVKRAKPAASRRMARNVGMCQQAQRELVRMLEYYRIPYELHKPSSRWKKQKKEFERATGWKGQSNENTRSAGYFGCLALR